MNLNSYKMQIMLNSVRKLFEKGSERIKINEDVLKSIAFGQIEN